MHSADAHSDDVWCVDTRGVGVLTLLVTKETYERLGLVGVRVPFKAQRDYFGACVGVMAVGTLILISWVGGVVIRLPLGKNVESVTNRARWSAALEAWDARREGAWNVVCASDDAGLLRSLPLGESQVRQVGCEMVTSRDVYIPIPSLSLSPAPRRSPSASGLGDPDISDLQRGDDDVDVDGEDWNAEMAALFEWVGMASLGSQRLHANDRVDPYVALYEHPSNSYVGDITRLRWSGLVGPAFLQSVIDTALAAIKTEPGTKAFVAITAHACLTSPVTYVPPSASVSGGPTRLARGDGEDTWCLLATPDARALVESLGQYDTRWG
ncbi:hypothetical protein C0992_007266 [Termitomyces sp. T32_za158]|nr:hypothetical protein C0992_007266 [Termitomyces sp. T32_za158]